MEAPETVEVLSGILECLIALAALAFAFLLARHESAGRDRIERKLEALIDALNYHEDEPETPGPRR